MHLAIKNYWFNTIKYLLYNQAWLDFTDEEGNNCRDLLWDAGLLYLIDNLQDGYESSIAKSSSVFSKRSNSSS